METREALLEYFTVDENGIITSHAVEGVRNAFVWQPLYVAWFWSNCDPVTDEDEDENGDVTFGVCIQPEDVELFPELAGREGEVITLRREIRCRISEMKEGKSFKSLWD